MSTVSRCHDDTHAPPPADDGTAGQSHRDRATEPGLTGYPCGEDVFLIAGTDADVPRAAIANRQAGFYRDTCDPTLLCNKSHQHAVIRATDPLLAFEGWHVDDVADLATDPTSPLVLRPAYSFSSKGSALIIDHDRIPDSEDLQQLRAPAGGYQIHRHLPGRPIFVNGVMSGGAFSLADCWRCLVMPRGCRDILVSVVNLPRARLPDALTERLARLAAAFGIDAGPLHFELVETDHGPKCVKCAPRLATEPLPGLCRLAGIGGQTALFEAGLACAFRDPLPDAAEPDVFVADYSFVADRHGLLRAMTGGDAIGALTSFDHIALAPPIGRTIKATCDGYSYGATFFLKHHDETVIDADIAVLDTMNRAGPFWIAAPGDET